MCFLYIILKLHLISLTSIWISLYFIFMYTFPDEKKFKSIFLDSKRMKWQVTFSFGTNEGHHDEDRFNKTFDPQSCSVAFCACFRKLLREFCHGTDYSIGRSISSARSLWALTFWGNFFPERIFFNIRKSWTENFLYATACHQVTNSAHKAHDHVHATKSWD